jgi:hypothetical protein
MPLLHLRRLHQASDGSDDRRKRLACADEWLKKGSLSVITYFYPDNPWAERAAQRILGDLNASGHYGLFVTYMLSGVTYA